VSNRTDFHGDRWRALTAATHLLLVADAATVYRAIGDGVTAILDCDSVRIYATEEGEQRLELALGRPVATDAEALERALVTEAVARGRSASSLDASTLDPLRSLSEAARRTHRLCHVRPLRGHDELLGALAVHSSRGSFTQDELDVLRRFGASSGFALASIRDRTELQRLAFTDALTGLPNRRELEHELAARATRAFSLLLVDFDGLKAINDGLTYDHGDNLIAAAGKAFAGLVREGELAARLAGDEFVVLIEEIDEARVAERAAAVGEALDRLPLPADVRPLFRGASVGAVTARPGEDPRDLLRRAAAALHDQKRVRKRVR
jgi:diguanylate cyclase (GGDEF)-like protein